MLYNARSADAHIDDGVCLGHAMERARHERVVVRRIAEYYQLGAAKGILLFGILGGLYHHFTHQTYRVHIKARFCGAHIDGAADTFRLRQSLRYGSNQVLLTLGHALGYQSRITADEVHTHLFGRFIQSHGQGHVILRLLAGRLADGGDGGDRNSLIYNGNAIIAFNS